MPSTAQVTPDLEARAQERYDHILLTRVGVIELPHLADAVRELGHRVVPDDKFPEAAAAIQITVDSLETG